MSKYYIAYGSNLSVEQMAYRCPGAKIAGMAAIWGWKLVFRYHATIEPEAGKVVPVLIWEITEQDERNLDRYEGWPHYYRKEDMTVTLTDMEGKNPKEITAMVYLMNSGRPVASPEQFYERLLREGYERFGFNLQLLHAALLEAKECEGDVS